VSLEGVDYAWGRPGGAALVAAGKHFAMRYVPYPGNGGKGLTTAELGDLQSHGLAVGLVFESVKGRALGGRAAGIADATMTAAAVTSLGFPADRPVYFAVDFDASAAQQASIDAYLRGAASVLGASRIGVYGGLDVVNRCAENGSAKWFWQTYAWSGGRQSAHAHLYQYHNGQTINGAAVDFDRALVSDFGQWMPLPDSSTGDAMPGLRFRFTGDGGTTTVTGSGHSLIRVYDKQYIAVPAGEQREAIAKVALLEPLDTRPGDRTNGYLVGKTPQEATNAEAGFMLASDVTFVAETVDCTDEVAAQREKDRTASLAAIEGVFA